MDNQDNLLQSPLDRSDVASALIFLHQHYTRVGEILESFEQTGDPADLLAFCATLKRGAN